MACLTSFYQPIQLDISPTTWFPLSATRLAVHTMVSMIWQLPCGYLTILVLGFNSCSTDSTTNRYICYNIKSSNYSDALVLMDSVCWIYFPLPFYFSFRSVHALSQFSLYISCYILLTNPDIKCKYIAAFILTHESSDWGWLNLTDQTKQVSPIPSPENGNRTSFWNVVFFRILDDGQGPKTQ
jgi:hypothetical protein